MFYEKKERKLEYMALEFLAKPTYIHFHSEVELLINMGRGADANVFINGKKYRLQNYGDAVLITPGQVHTTETLSDGLFMAFIFPVEYIPRLQKTLLTMQPTTPFFNTKEIGADDIILSFWKTHTDFPPDTKHTRSSVIIGYMNILMAHLYYKLDFQEIEDDNALIKKIVLYLSEHYTEPITLADLSEALKVPHAVISKVFNSATGITVPTFLNWVRASAAADLLLSSNNTITSISSLVGFRTIRNFNRTFVDFYGTTPSNYRSMHK